MSDHEKVVEAVIAAIDELNQQLPKAERAEKSLDSVLFGDGGNLDSLRLVSLVTTLEQKIEENFGTTVSVFDHLASFENNNPFMTVKSMADFVSSILENH